MQNALSPDAEIDHFVYKPDDMFKYGQEFLGHIDPRFAKDIKENYEWYMEN